MESRFTRAGIRASVSYCVARSLCKILEDDDDDDDDDKPLLAAESFGIFGRAAL